VFANWSSAVTVTVRAEPAVCVAAPASRSFTATAGATVAETLPVIVPAVSSVAVIVFVPAVLSVAPQIDEEGREVDEREAWEN